MTYSGQLLRCEQMKPSPNDTKITRWSEGG